MLLFARHNQAVRNEGRAEIHMGLATHSGMLCKPGSQK